MSDQHQSELRARSVRAGKLVISWLVSVTILGYIITLPSPHGMAAFFQVSLVLAIVGALLHSSFYLYKGRQRAFTSVDGIGIGLISGIAAYPVAAYWLHASSFWPTNMYQVAIAVYLIFAGIAFGFVFTKVVLGDKNQQA